MHLLIFIGGVNILLDHDADMTIVDLEGDTALTLTCVKRNEDILNVLVQRDKSQGGKALLQGMYGKYVCKQRIQHMYVHTIDIICTS